jgi:ribosomal protein L11 methyltransferase
MPYPALTVLGVDPDLVLAAADDYSPSAAEPCDGGLRVFFRDRTQRDAARTAISRQWPHATVTQNEIADDGWAERSQRNLPPVSVGRLRILSATSDPPAPSGPALPPLVIQPSTGFGTGHHASTRLCLAALQTIDLHSRLVLDVGTGSGILAIAAGVLGAAKAVGIDDDPDALRAARDNVSLNSAARQVSIEFGDLTRGTLPAADVVVANLTGTLLQQAADTLLGAVADGGFLIVSGMLREERDAVAAAFRHLRLIREEAEDEWVALMFQAPKKNL